jgi:phosphate transport system substrate-binding protein
MSQGSSDGLVAPQSTTSSTTVEISMTKLSYFTATALTVVTLAIAGKAEARTQIRIVGSSTVYPFTTAVAEQFARNSGGKFKAPIVEATGTGAGMKLFCAGVGPANPDMTNASRRIKASELAMCQQNGVSKVIEVQIGLDGLALAHAKSAPAFALTTRDIYMALSAAPWGKPQKAKTWKDVNSKLPADKIELIGPPPTSGTRDSFNDLFMEVGCNSNTAMAALKKSDEPKYKSMCTKIREDGAYVEAGENDNLIVQRLVANPKAVGAFGYSNLEENLDKLQGVAINGIEPTAATVQSFKYPASRALFVYVKAAHMAAIPGMKEFLAEYSKESSWGPRGYLVRRGLIPSVDAQRAAAAKNAIMLTPLNPATVK